jgi:hypothetical protein
MSSRKRAAGDEAGGPEKRARVFRGAEVADLDSDDEGGPDEAEPEPDDEPAAASAAVEPKAMDTAASLSPLERYASSWARPAAPVLDPARDSVAFMLVDADYTVEPRADGGDAPVVRLFGSTLAGNSVLLRATDFGPYFFCRAPPGLGYDAAPDALESARATLDAALERASRQRYRGARVTALEALPRASLEGFSDGATEPFLKITVALPRMVPTLRELLERGVPLGEPYGSGPAFGTARPLTLAQARSAPRPSRATSPTCCASWSTAARSGPAGSRRRPARGARSTPPTPPASWRSSAPRRPCCATSPWGGGPPSRRCGC